MLLSRMLSCLAPLLALITTGGRLLAQEQDLYDDTVLRTLHLTFHQDNWWDQLIRNKERENGEYIAADLVVDGIPYPLVGVRMRGKASYYYANEFKKPFKIKLDHYVPDQELYGHDSIRLNNCWEDPSFLREVIYAKLLGQYIPTSRQAFVKLVINGENWGVYVSEQQKDKKFMGEWYREVTGNRYKSVLGGNLSYLGPDPPPYQGLYLNQAEDNPDPWYDLIDFCYVLNNTNVGSDLTEALRPMVDLDGTIWMIAGDNVFGNLDSYYVNRNNYYVIHDDYHDLLEVVNHDLGLCLGTWDNVGANLDPTYKFNADLTPLIKNLFQDGQLLREYFAHIRTLVDEVFRWDVIEPLALQYRDLIRDEVHRDDKKLYSTAWFEDSLTTSHNGQFFQIPGLQTYIEARESFLRQHPDINQASVELGDIAVDPPQPTSADDITFTVPVIGSTEARRVVLRWRARGPFQLVAMEDDGLHGDGAADDGVFGAVLPALPAGAEVEFLVTAVARGSRAITFQPPRGNRFAFSLLVGSPPGPSLAVNEFLARNVSDIADEAGEQEDWLELVNTDSATVDLSGLYLSDDVGQPAQWQIPAGTALGPGETLLVWADAEESDGPYHANFKLDGDGEEIALFDRDGTTLLDHVVFGPQQSDVSTGRVLDSDPRWVTFDFPTPDAGNKPSCGVRRFSALDPAVHPVTLNLTGAPDQGQPMTLEIGDGPAGGTALVLVAFAPAYRPTADGVFLVDLALFVPLLAPLNAAGRFRATTTLPADGSLLGIDLYLQAWCLGIDRALTASNAAELRLCQ